MGEEQHSLAGEGVGTPNADDWKESLALGVLCETTHKELKELGVIITVMH
jgi:hypothetical protein